MSDSQGVAAGVKLGITIENEVFIGHGVIFGIMRLQDNPPR